MFKFIVVIISVIVVTLPEVTHAQFTESRPYKTEAGPYSLNIQADPSQLSLGTNETAAPKCGIGWDSWRDFQKYPPKP